MVKLQENSGQFFVAVPKLMVKKKKWKKGQEIIASFNENGDIVLMEV